VIATSAADVAAARWLAANRAAIAATHDARARAVAQKTLDATLARMRAAARAASPPPGLRAAAARELASGAYDLTPRIVRPAEKSAWDRFWDWFWRQWDRIWKATGARVRLGSAALNAIGWVLLAAAFGALVYLAVRLVGALQFDRERRRGHSSPLEAARSARVLYAQALALARDGAYAQAARLLFVAAVTALDLRGLMRDDASATVGELRRALRARDAAMLPPFDEIAGPFVAAAYAERDIAQTEWERALAGYHRLVRAEQT
jgi:hypothetical protein